MTPSSAYPVAAPESVFGLGEGPLTFELHAASSPVETIRVPSEARDLINICQAYRALGRGARERDCGSSVIDWPANVTTKKHAAGTGGSLPVDLCQICESPNLEPVLFLGYLPPVNTMPRIGERPKEQPAYPAQLLRCPKCSLVQLGLVVDPGILFPPSYPYTSGTTRILRENFAELSDEAHALFSLAPSDLVVDIGSNDGTLLQNFAKAGHRVFGIEPTDAGKLARDKGIPTLTSFFNRDAAERVVSEHGKARVVTAANVFAHIEDVHAVMDNVLHMLPPVAPSRAAKDIHIRGDRAPGAGNS
jgi:hypothetical protein